MIAATWWGHSSVTLELGTTRIGIDPLFAPRLAHLRRHHPVPTDPCDDADVVLVSHLHGDHLHVPSLRRFEPETRFVVPRGAGRLLRGLPNPRHEVAPGETVTIGPMRIDVLPAHHDGRRWARSRLHAPALGFRIAGRDGTCWYPGDTGLFEAMADVEPVDLALVPIGGWGPSLGDEHLDPLQACEAVTRVGASHALPVHYGTYWPIGLTLARRTHHRLFIQPADLFRAQMQRQLPGTRVHVPRPGDRIEITAVA